MAADQVFQDVLNYVEKSRLNFSIYRTPFSAQLSLKKSFAKYFQEDKVETIMKTESHTFEIQIMEMEARLKNYAAEIYNYLDAIKEKDEKITLLETKCHNLERSQKVERKKMKKERQKEAKKVEIDETNIKHETTDDEELDPDIPTFNKFKALAQDLDRVEEKMHVPEEPCNLCEQRLLFKNRLKVSIIAGEEVLPVSKTNVSVQTVEIVLQEPQVKDEIVNENISDEKSELSSTLSIIAVRRVEATDKTIEEVIKDKLALKGVKVLEVYIQRSANGNFSRCDARIEAVQGKFIDETDFQFQNCRVIPLFENTEEDLKTCDFCGIEFGNLEGLRSHIRSLHREMLPT